MSFWSRFRGTTENLLGIGVGGISVKNNSGAIEFRNSGDTGFVWVRGQSVLPTVNLLAAGAVGDNSTDDTTAIQTAVNTAAAVSTRGVVVFPPPSVSYKITSKINVPAGITLLGLNGPASSDFPLITQWTYGATVFDCVGDNITIHNICAQYGPTTTVTGTVAVGSTSITPASTSGISANDWLILDQYPNLEQVQVTSVSGGTVNLASATTITHTGTWWVRDQAVVGGATVYGYPPRAVSGLAVFSSGNDCAVIDCAVQAMVTGVWFRGVPTSNSANNTNNTINGFVSDYCQYAILSAQQNRHSIYRIQYTNSTEGQPTAPGHLVYTTGLNGLSSTWNGSSTYIQYQQVSYQGLQYIAISGNTGQNPSTTPSVWSLQSGGALGFQSFCNNVIIDDVYSSCGANFKDWTGFSLKFINGGIATNLRMENAVRGFNLQGCTDFVVSNFSLNNFQAPLTTDSQAAAIDILNCNRCWIGNGIVDLRTTSGGAIDMPVALNRIDTTAGSTLDTVGQFNTFANIDATTNYDVSFTSYAYHNAGGAHNKFINCSLNDLGGTNPTAFAFRLAVTSLVVTATANNGSGAVRCTVSSNSGISIGDTGVVSSVNSDANGTWPLAPVSGTTNQIDLTGSTFTTAFSGTGSMTISIYSNNSQVIMPVVVGTTALMYVATGITGSVLSIDDNLVPAGFTVAGPVIRNDQPASLTLSPTSTSATVITASAPVSAAYRWINLLNSASNTEFAITTGAATGLKTQFLSSANGNGSFLGLGYNTAGGYPASGNVFGGVSFVANNASVGPNAAGMYAVAAEAQGSSALGTDLEFQVIAPTTSTAYRSFRLYGSGDVVVNATNAALATSANAGWFYMPSMAGEPTGSPTARTGAIPFVFDTTNGRLWLKNGSVISDVAAASVPTAGPVTGSTLTAGSIQRLGSSQAGNSYVLPNPATCTGSAIQVKCTNNGGIYQYFFTSSSGNIDGTASYTFVSQYQYASVTFVSDGANWQIEDGYGPGYLEDRPRFHGLVEWNGQPAYFNSSLALTSGSLNVYRIVAQTGGTISNICAYVSALGSGMTAATSTTVTATANNGSGAVRCTVTTSTGIGPTAVVAGVNADANGSWAVTVVDGTHVDLIGSTFVTTFSGSGTITTSANCAAIYSGSGAFLGSTADQVSAWGSTGGKTMALANTVAVQAGGVYYIAILFTGTASTFALWSASSGTVGMGNFNTTGSNLRWAVNGAGLTALPSSITPSSASATNAHGGWIALS